MADLRLRSFCAEFLGSNDLLLTSHQASKEINEERSALKWRDLVFLPWFGLVVNSIF